MKTKQQHEISDVYARADVLSRMGSTVDKVVKYLNAEFNICFYANKSTVWATYMEAGKPEYRKIGVFA